MQGFDEIEKDFISGIWSEKILVITKDYEISGNVFMPRTGRKNRLLSDILNGGKRFVAIKDCTIIHREYPEQKSRTPRLFTIEFEFNNIT